MEVRFFSIILNDGCDMQSIYSFWEKKILEAHVSAVHEGKKQVTCHLCGQNFARVVGMKQHIERVHEGKKPFQCSKCDASFADSSNLKRHFRSVHEGKKPYLCPICGSGFAQNVNLKQHIVKIHEKNSFSKKLLEMQQSLQM